MHFDIQLNKGIVDVTKPLDLTFSLEKGRLVGSFNIVNSLFAIETCELNLGPQGTIHLPNIINKKIPLRRISIVANYLVNTQKLELENILADLAGPTLRLRGVFQEIAEQISFEIGADIKEMKIGAMAQFWPNNLGPLARTWVTKNLSVGSISTARAKLSGRWSEEAGPQIDSLIGDMNFNNITVDYSSPMLKATRANGSAKFDKRMLEIELDDAQRGDLKLSYGRLLFTGLDEVDQYTDITLKIDGPLKSAVKLLDNKPLGFAKKFGIKAENVQGLVSTDINLKFIVEEKLTPDQIAFSAKATLIRGKVPDVAFENTLTDATLMLNANNSTLKIEGEGLLDNIPVKLITDNMSGFFMKNNQIDLVVVGADRIAGNGDVANKIGTYMVAVMAQKHGVPFYVAAPISTLDLTLSSGEKIPIEQRSENEVAYVNNKRITPEGANVAHPAFDITPNNLITAIITNKGIAKPPYTTSLKQLAEQ